MTDSYDHLKHLSLQERAAVNDLVARFEESWQQGLRPQIENFLPAEQRLLRAALVELVHVELETRLKAGEQARVEAYLERFPQLFVDQQTVLKLVTAEYEFRRRVQPDLDLDEYQERFPELWSDLETQPARQSSPPSIRYPLRLNCPHCRNPIEIVAEEPDDELVCPSCGSTFHVEGDRTESWSPEKLPTLGKFKLLAAVGRGAFGTVYRAEDTELDRVVAIKIPRSGSLATGEDEDRFVREARSVAQLQHPGIVPVYEVGRSETFPYIVAEFVDGITLADALTARQFSFRESAELITGVAEALEHAHEQGVVHRDLKPSNIMLSSHGTPKLMDFGLAKRDAGEITMTVEGQVLGTPAYMSPEQAAGEAHHVDRRSDVYSLGVILYQLLTGELPFRGNQRMLLHQVMHDEPRKPRSLNDRIPRDLETICLKAMTKEPGKRYATALELADDLKRWMNGEPILAHPVGRIERTWRWARRNPLVAALSSTAAALLLLVAIVATIGHVKTSDALSRVDLAKREAVRERESAEQQRGQVEESLAIKRQAMELAEEKTNHARRERYASDINLAASALQENKINHAISLLERYLDHGKAQRRTLPAVDSLDPEIDLRGFEWFYLWRQCHQEVLQLDHPWQVNCIACTPDGHLVAGGGPGPSPNTTGAISIWDTRSGERVVGLGRHHNPVTSLAFSPDGTRLISSSAPSPPLAPGQDSAGEIIVWDMTTHDEVANLIGHQHGVLSIAISPDGSTLASGGGNKLNGSSSGELMIWDMSRLELETSLTGHSSAVAFLSFSPDGTVLAASEKGGLTKVWNTSTWDSEHELFSEQHKANVVAFPRTNGHVAYAIDTQVKLCDLSNDSSRVLLDQPDFEISSLAFSPDGDKLIAAGGSLHGLDGELYLVDVESGETLRSFHGNRKPVRSAAFLSNGQKIATASGELVARFWSETANPSVSVVDLGSEPLIGVSFLPDEAGLLCVGLRNLTVVDPVNFKVKDKLPSFIVPLKTFALSPDGTLFACGDFERNIYLLNLVSNTTVAKLGQFQALVKSLSFSPDGKFLAAAGGMETEEMSVWRLSDRKLVGEPKGHDMTIFSLIVSPDGSVAATASGDNNIKLWNPKTWQETMTLSGADNGGVNDLAFSFDSLTLASAAGYERRIKIWDTLTGNLLQTMESNSESITSLAFGSTNNLIASGSDQGTVYIWDVNTGRELLSLSAGKSYITSLSFSPSQTELLATTSSGELLVWRAPRETAQ